MNDKIMVALASAAFSLSACQGGGGPSSSDKPGSVRTVAAVCPSGPAVGRSGSVAGIIEGLEKGGTIAFISVRSCAVRIITPIQAARSCKRGGAISAQGAIQEYDLFPTMETLFIDAKSVECA